MPDRDIELRRRLAEFGAAPLGDRDWLDGRPDYVAELSLTDSDAPTLIAVAQEWVRWYEEEDIDWENRVDLDAPIHAWRGLAQLRSTAAIEPLIDVANKMAATDTDMLHEDLAFALSYFGEPSVEPLVRFARDPSANLWARVAAIDALERVAKREPVLRDRVVEALREQLACFEDEHDVEITSSLVASLDELHAIEALHEIRRAFEAGSVDRSFCGDWRDVEYRLKRGKRRTVIPWEKDGLRRHDPKQAARLKKKRERQNKKKSRR